ncbi:NAD(+) ADP-ribosyltransferase [Ranunculus cassubicifolius]
MADHKLKVDQYFSQLPQRGLGVVLVQRSSALYEENTKDYDEIDNLLVNNKRNREEFEDDDLVLIEAVEHVEKLYQMNIRQSRDDRTTIRGSMDDPVEILDDYGVVSKKRKIESADNVIVIDDVENVCESSDQTTIHDENESKKQLLQRVCDYTLNDLVEIRNDEIYGFVNKKEKTELEEEEEDDDLILIENVEYVDATSRVADNGLKKQLSERVCGDSLDEIVEIPDDEFNEFEYNKRKTETVEGKDDFIEVEKVEDVEKLRQMDFFQLGEQATIRGIQPNGSMKQLLERVLFSDSMNDPLENSDEVDRAGKKKLVKATKKGGAALDQKLPLEDGEVIMIDKVRDVEKLREIGLRQLREQATLRGVSASGSKKQLLERLYAADTGGKEKLVIATKKGGAVLDQWLPDDTKAGYHVLQHGGEIYDAMLNLTDVGENSNKFCVIQALESDDGLTFMVYSRSGRVGVKGHVQLVGPFPSRDTAIRVFDSRFYAKTKVKWAHRKYMVCKPKCYAWLEMDYDGNNITVAEKPNHSIQPRVSTLDPRIAKFLSLICNLRMMKQQMMEIGYNAEMLPLGKLSKSTILKGFGVLKRIYEVIGQSDRKTLEQLSGEFYTVIPHDFGYKKMSEFVIDTQKKLKRKLQMVEALREIQVATKLINDGNEMQEDPLYSHYRNLRCELIALDIHSQEYAMIERYMRNTHANTHLSYTVDIVQIFRISRHGETERFKKYFYTNNRMLLWHGSRLTNWTGILSQGLRIAPPEAPSNGSMFGRGVYFADMFSKSANYCCSGLSSSGVLLLCEVALGDMAECMTANHGASRLPYGKSSTKGVGATAPDPSGHIALEDGVIVPLGKPMPTGRLGAGLLYNEYIVYNVDQIRMRYVIQVNFNYNGSRAF